MVGLSNNEYLDRAILGDGSLDCIEFQQPIVIVYDNMYSTGRDFFSTGAIVNDA